MERNIPESEQKQAGLELEEKVESNYEKQKREKAGASAPADAPALNYG